MTDAAIAVVVVVHNSADELPASLLALQRELRDGDEAIIVDNASSDATVALALELLPAARIVRNIENVGFAGGCNRGVETANAPLVLLLNPDAVVQPGCLDALRDAADAHPSWGAWQAVVTVDDGRLLNTSGNAVHWLGFGWAAGLGEPAAAAPETDREVGFGSGAALVVRRDQWVAAGGFDDRYFMYCEDLDLSLRLRLAGWEIGVAVAARADHSYEFAKGDYKWFWLERNRWWTVLGSYPAIVLLWALPGLLAFELAVLPVAWRGGWLGPKLRAQRAVVRELPAILRRRRGIQATSTISAREFAASLTTSLDSPHLAAASRIRPLAAAQDLYWRALLRVLR